MMGGTTVAVFFVQSTGPAAYRLVPAAHAHVDQPSRQGIIGARRADILHPATLLKRIRVVHLTPAEKTVSFRYQRHIWLPSAN